MRLSPRTLGEIDSPVSTAHALLGLPRLREAFAAELSRDYGGAVSPANVIITAGCNQAFSVVASALAGPGEEVIVPLPYYFNHDMGLRLGGVTPVYLETGVDLVPRAEAAEALITPRTRSRAAPPATWPGIW